MNGSWLNLTCLWWQTEGCECPGEGTPGWHHSLLLTHSAGPAEPAEEAQGSGGASCRPAGWAPAPHLKLLHPPSLWPIKRFPFLKQNISHSLINLVLSRRSSCKGAGSSVETPLFFEDSRNSQDASPPISFFMPILQKVFDASVQ